MKTRIIFSSLKLFVWVSLLLYSSISFPQFKPGGLGVDNINIICGTDEREPSDNAAVGRLLGIDINDRVVYTGTAFVLNNGMLVSAGHVKTEAEKVYAVRFEVEFNVKPSSTYGDMERSEPTDIYEVNLIEDYWFGIKGGRDYWIFEVYRNQITGLLPSDIASLEFVTNFSSTDFGTNAKMEVVGFGTAAGAKNLTQQSAIDDFYEIYQGYDPDDNEHFSQIVYKTDTAPGCSGGPVIVSSGSNHVGKVVGIHSAKYSEGSGGIPCTNYGTAFTQETLADILTNVVHNKYKKVAVQIKLKRWWDGEFKPYSLNTEMVPTHLDLFFRYGDNETFQADENVTNGLKFHKWKETDYYKNHNTFSVTDLPNEVEALKDVPVGNITLRNSLIESDAIEFGSIYFKDPWLTKNNQSYDDPPYGYRNLGNPAIFEQLASPLVPSLSSIYKGVFLEQSIDPSNSTIPYYAMRAKNNFTATLAHTGKSHNFYFRGWSTVNVTLYDTLQNPPYGFEQKAVVFNNNNALVKANYKGTQLTDNNETYSNNNQRKVIKTPDGRMHSIYESNGSFFYEISYDNGDNWLLNDEIYIYQNPTWEIFDPVIDYYVNGALTHILIGFVLQRGDPDGDWLRTYHYYYEDEVAPLKVSEENIPPLALESNYEYLRKPTLAINENGDAVLFVVATADDKSQLRWLTLGFTTECNNDYYCFTYKNSGTYSGSQYNQDNPVVSALKNNSSNKFHLAYQENEQIKYDDITLGSNYSLLNISPVTLSTGSGYQYNRYPSLTVMNDNYARVTWQGTRYTLPQDIELGKVNKSENQNSNEETEEVKVVFRSSDYNYFWSFGNNTGKPNINRHSVGYAFAWSENGGCSVKAVNNTLNLANIKTLTGLSGEGVQMTNGSSINDMYAVSLNTTAVPYYFMRSNSLGSYDLSKEKVLSISSGREGVVYNEGAEFYYAIGDIKLNGSNIDFVEIPDSVKTINLASINEYLKSQTMSVDNASQLLYSVQYGMIDSASTKNYLQTGKTITFGVELVDAITNNVLGRYDEVTFDENNMYRYNKLGYEVSLDGIGTNREVYLRLATTSNDETSGYSLTQRYSDETILGKTHTKKINYTGTEKPTEYALFQNYPNPFNPVTTITYQIPKEGLVTLKVYDILGKEVTTLVNEEKENGKYSVEFNASKLSSGVYLYELRSNEYKSTKKLLLMK